MMTTTLIIFAGFLCLALMYYVVQGRIGPFETAEQVERHFVAIDLLAFQNLIDPDDQRFLRELLPSKKYRKIQRERISSCLRYVRCCGRNAAVLIRVGETASEDQNPEIQATAERIISEAIRMRIYAVVLVPKICIWWVFPDSEFSLAAMCRKYSQMTTALAALNNLKEPAFPLSNLATI